MLTQLLALTALCSVTVGQSVSELGQCDFHPESDFLSSVLFSSSIAEGTGCMRDAFCSSESVCVCKDGFVGDGFNCEPVKTCALPKLIENGHWIFLGDPRINGNIAFPGDKIKIICDVGYTMNHQSHKRRTCRKNGKWSIKTHPVCVVAKCDAPDHDISNGYSTVRRGTKYKVGEVIEYSCWSNFRIKGYSWQTCVSRDSLSGRWSNSPPSCEVIQCYDVGRPDNTNRIGNPPYNVGDEVMFRCSSGYKLIGSESRICQENGKWSGNITICDNGAGHCQNPGTPINGRKEGRRYNEGNKVRFNCDIGFHIVGSRERTCMNTGKWSGSQPTCRGPGDYDEIVDVAKTFGTKVDKFVNETGVGKSTVFGFGRSLDISFAKYGRLEIYLAIDASGSISEKYFNKSIAFAKALVKKTGVSARPIGTKYAGIIYTDEIVDEFPIFEYQSTQGVIDHFDRIKYKPGGGTATNVALTHIEEIMIPLSNNRLEGLAVKRVIILITDGESNSHGNPVATANRLKMDEAVEIYVIGVGQGVTKNNKEIIEIASETINEDDPYTYFLKDHSSLEELATLLAGETIDYSRCGRAGHTEGFENDDDRGRISGGTDAAIGAWPWQINIWKSEHNVVERAFCGGSIISSKWILTAAHCFYDHKDFNTKSVTEWPKYMLIGLGYTKISPPESYTKIVAVQKVIPHPDYVPYSSDLALIELKESIEFTKYIQPVCLPNISDSTPTEGERLLTTGWGNSINQTIKDEIAKKNTNSTNHLQQLWLNVSNRDKCVSSINETLSHYRISYVKTKGTICLGGNTWRSACQGDSGGPVVKKIPKTEVMEEHWIQFGIVSFGFGCGVAGKHDVDTNVVEYTEWIQNKTSIQLGY